MQNTFAVVVVPIGDRQKDPAQLLDAIAAAGFDTAAVYAHKGDLSFAPHPSEPESVREMIKECR